MLPWIWGRATLAIVVSSEFIMVAAITEAVTMRRTAGSG
jgi:hypothetical protein